MIVSIKERVLITYSNTRRNYEILHYFSDNSQIRNLIPKEPLLYQINYVIHKDLFIELSKLVKFKKDKNTNEIILDDKCLLGIAINENNKNIEDKESLIKEILTEKKFVTKVTNTRDKYFAHLDKDYRKYTKGRYTPHELEELMVKIQNIIIKLYSEVELKTYLSKIPNRTEYDFFERKLSEK